MNLRLHPETKIARVATGSAAPRRAERGRASRFSSLVAAPGHGGLQDSAPEPVPPGSHLPPGRTMHRWRPLGTPRLPWHVDQTWTTLVGTCSRPCRRAAAIRLRSDTAASVTLRRRRLRHASASARARRRSSQDDAGVSRTIPSRHAGVTFGSRAKLRMSRSPAGLGAEGRNKALGTSLRA